MNTLFYGGIALVAGLLAVLPISVLQMFSLSLAAGIVEEVAKTVALFILPRKEGCDVYMSHRWFLIGGLLAGLAFGLFETVVYVFSGVSLLMRICGALPLHISCAIFDAESVYRLKNREKPLWRSFVPLASSIIFHLLYNYFAVLGTVFRFFAYVVVIASCYGAYRYFSACVSSNEQNNKNTENFF